VNAHLAITLLGFTLARIDLHTVDAAGYPPAVPAPVVSRGIKRISAAWSRRMIA
jgi:hypothetical protein